MHQFPHHYTVEARGGVRGDVTLDSPGLPTLPTNAPPEYDGPGGVWSPETLLVGAVANCFILTFRAVAAASKLPWVSLECEVTGTLERADRTTLFTSFHLRAALQVQDGTSTERAREAMSRAERGCLITNSLKAPTHLDTSITVAEPAQLDS
jgi:organic hydroperoxide reductase OsmC/OhrA